MKKIIILLMLYCFIPSALNAMEIVRLTNGEWPPYLSEHLPHYGLASDIVQKAFAIEGVNVEYGFFPWKRSYMLAKSGLWNGTLVWVYTKKRAEDFYYSDVVIQDNEYLFHLKNFHLKWSRVEDLDGLVIGGTLHTAYPFFAKMEKKGRLMIERAGTYENLFKRLIKRRIDAVPQVSGVGFYLVRTTLTKEERAMVTFSPTIIEQRKYSLILSKKIKANKRYLELFNSGFKKLKKSGKYNEMISKMNQGYYDRLSAQAE